MLLYFFPTGAPLNLLSYGENMIKAANDKWTSHAEENAIRKLPVLPRKKHLKKVDLLVIRTSKTGVLGSSKPCIHCLMLLQTKLPEKGYKIQNIFYTNQQGDIREETLKSLLEDENMHMSKYYRERCFQVTLPK